MVSHIMKHPAQVTENTWHWLDQNEIQNKVGSSNTNNSMAV